MKESDIYYHIFAKLIENVMVLNKNGNNVSLKSLINEDAKLLEVLGFRITYLTANTTIYGVEAIGNGCEFKWEVS